MSANDDGNLLKRRLLGAAVLIALAVIFLPLLLDGSGSESRFRRVEQLRVEPPRIVNGKGQVEKPEKPVVEPVEVKIEKPVVAPPAAATPAPAPEPEPVPEAAPVVPATEIVAPAPAEVVLPKNTEVTDSVAWIVQAGSFSAEANAIGVRDQLRESGFPAFISAADANSAPVYRVKVGPITDKGQATKVQERVQNLLGQKTIIKQYP